MSIDTFKKYNHCLMDSSNLKTLVKVLLNKDSNHGELLNSARGLSDFFEKFSSLSTKDSHYESNDSTHTYLSSGVAISPLDAAICTNEYLRTTKYIRGVFEALNDLLIRFKGKKLHILYAGCGPYGTLLIPLLHLFDPKDIEVTFLDIHTSSLNSIKNILQSIGLEKFGCTYVQEDATKYKLLKDTHLIITETMKAAFWDEPQVAISLNLLPQLSKGGEFIPNRVVVGFEGAHYKQILKDNILLKEKVGIYLCDVIDLDSSKDMNKDNLVSTTEYILSQNLNEKVELQFITDIYIYKDNILRENECSLNIPRKVLLDEKPIIGDTINFEYEFSNEPKIKYDVNFMENDLTKRVICKERTSNFSSTEKSLQIGKLKIFHIKFLWERKMLEYEVDKSNEHLLNQLDYFVLDGLNIPIEKAILYLYTKRPDFGEFEEWILSWHDGFISPELIKKINDAVIDFIQNGQQNYPLEVTIDDPIFSDEEMKFWKKNGYIVLKDAVDKKDCKELVDAIWEYQGLSSKEPQNWNNAKDRFWLKEFEHPLLEKNKASEKIHKAFEQLWGTDKLFHSTNRISFNSPLDKTIDNYGPNKLHWDISLARPVSFDLLGMLYLNDIKEDQGAFQCIPCFHKKLDLWLERLKKEENPREEILKEKYQKESIKISAKAGDFIICRQELPHSSSINKCNYPRFVQYIAMYPPNRRIDSIWK